MLAGFIVIISGAADVLAVQDFGVICLSVECLRVEELPVDPCFAPDAAALVGGLVYEALRGVAAEKRSEVETVA